MNDRLDRRRERAGSSRAAPHRRRRSVGPVETEAHLDVVGNDAHAHGPLAARSRGEFRGVGIDQSGERDRVIPGGHTNRARVDL